MRWLSRILVCITLATLVLGSSPQAAHASQLPQSGLCDSAVYVTDLSYPDGAVVPAGEPFTKIWRFKNNGTCTWTSSYKLVFVSGNPLGGPSEKALGRSVAPGETIDIAVNLTAPAALNTYYSYWRLMNESGTQFGIGSNGTGVFWIKIKTEGLEETTSPPTSAPTLPSTATADPTPCNWASYVGDVTIPDNTLLAPGQAFTKTWRIKNIGTCTWSTAYKLVFISGNQLGGPASAPLSKSVAPGETLDISVNLTAPNSEGTHYSYWRLENAAGQRFGIGSNASGVIWIKIKTAGAVVPSATPQQPTFTPTPTTAATATPTLSPAETPCEWASYVTDVTTPDGTRLAPGQVFTKTWRFRNIGTCTWTTEYRLVYESGNPLGGPASVPMPKSVTPGQTVDISVNLVAPNSEGTFYSYWRLQNADGQRFGIGSKATGVFWIKIITVGAAAAPTATPTPIFTPSAYCDHASLVKDVTVPDLTLFTGNTQFTKTWRLKNIGTCTWTTGYKLFYDSGNQMRGPAEVPLARSVAPGEEIDVSVNLIAPGYPSDYLGYWRLKNASGQIFGVGRNAIGIFWVKIRVVEHIRESFPFHDLFCQAAWVNGNGASLPCPGKYNMTNGSVIWTWNPVLQTGQTRHEQPSLITIPNNSGSITGTFPAYHVMSSDRFTTTLSCFADHPNCDVTFELNYIDANGQMHTFFGPYRHSLDMPILPLDLKLTPLAGQTVQFVMTVRSNGSNGDDYALWLYPTIWRD